MKRASSNGQDGRPGPYGQPLPPDQFDSLRYSDVEPGDSDLVVDYPETFARPPGSAPAGDDPRGVSPVAPAQPMAYVGKTGVSAGTAFFLGMLAQILLLAGVGGLAFYFPDEAGRILKQAAYHIGMTGSAQPSAVRLHSSPGSDSERLLILQLEDRAIFRGERVALDELQRRANEVDSGDYTYDAVQASLIRIRQSYEFVANEMPPPLDPREVFPTATNESDLSLASIVQVLRDRRLSPDKRRRAAYLLMNDRSASAQNALFQAIQDDPNLLVVRQAFESFRSTTGYPGRNSFDSDAVAHWWNRNAGAFLGQN